MKIDPKLLVPTGRKIRLREYNTSYTGNYSDKQAAKEALADHIQIMAKLQDMLYASHRYSLLIIFQALDAAGKDGTIKHVMSGINPEGCQVVSFKQPSVRELSHDYLWREIAELPERGMIGIFNRSYYEEVLIAHVHPEIVLRQNIPGIETLGDIKSAFWEKRCDDINCFENYLTSNGTRIIKFFLHIGKKEQKRRFLERIDNPDKNWKVTMSDAEERKFWPLYQKAYEETLSLTSTKAAPWYIIPADNKWSMRALVSNVIIKTLSDLKLRYPVLPPSKIAEIKKIRQMLVSEKE
jgi:PPK2 family polyphosphate:nucleotide phosphotransferase